MEISLEFPPVAVAALERGDHGGDGEGQQEEPDDDGDLRRLLQHFDKVPAPEMHHVEVAVDGQSDEEGDAGSPVEEEHGEHDLADHGVTAAPLSVKVVVGLDGEAGHQQEVSDHNVEQEDAFVLPELEPEKQVSYLYHKYKVYTGSSRERQEQSDLIRVNPEYLHKSSLI